MRRRIVLACTLILLIVAQPAEAVTVNGELIVEGALQLPSAAHLGFVPIGVFLNETAGIRLALTTPSATVHVMEERHGRLTLDAAERWVQTTPPQQMQRSYRLTNLTLDVLDGGDGWLGLFPRTGSHANFVSGHDIGIASSLLSVIGNAAGTADNRDPRLPYYHMRVDHPHLSTSAPGDFQHVGGGMLKLMGPTVRITAYENTTEHSSGTFRTSDEPVHEVVERWLVVVFDSGELHMASPSKLDIIADAMDLAWEGESRFTPLSGEIRRDSTSYRADGRAALLEGAFEAHATTLKLGSSSGMHLWLSGDLVATTMQASLIQLPSAAAGPGSLLLLSIVVGLVGGGAGVAMVQLARRRTPAQGKSLSVDQLVAMANMAAEMEHFAEALEWVQQARLLAPSSARLCLDEAFFLESLGENEAALERYVEASGRSDDGEAEFMIARLLLRMEASLDEVEAALSTALAKAPTFVLEVEDDSAFNPLRSRPSFRMIIRQAHNRKP